MTDTQLPAGVRQIKALEVSRPCGCVEILVGPKAVMSKALKMAAKACYAHGMEARQIARAKAKGGLLCDTCGRPPYFGTQRAGSLCGRSGVSHQSIIDGRPGPGACAGTLIRIAKDTP